MGREEILTNLIHNRDRVLARLDEPEKTLARTYGRGKWSAREVLAHIADAEFVNLWRFYRATAEPGSHVEVFSETAWAERLAYATRPVDLSRRTFGAARAMLIHSLQTMSDETLRGVCHHPEKGVMNGFDWAELTLEHCEHHLGQVDAACDGSEWTPVLHANAWKYGAAPPPAKAMRRRPPAAGQGITS